jgi:hypothetical protein
MKIPKGTTANVSIRLKQNQEINIESNEKKSQMNQIEGISTGRFQLEEGDYLIKVTH